MQTLRYLSLVIVLLLMSCSDSSLITDPGTDPDDNGDGTSITDTLEFFRSHLEAVHSTPAGEIEFNKIHGSTLAYAFEITVGTSVGERLVKIMDDGAWSYKPKIRLFIDHPYVGISTAFRVSIPTADPQVWKYGNGIIKITRLDTVQGLISGVFGAEVWHGYTTWGHSYYKDPEIVKGSFTDLPFDRERIQRPSAWATIRNVTTGNTTDLGTASNARSDTRVYPEIWASFASGNYQVFLRVYDLPAVIGPLHVHPEAHLQVGAGAKTKYPLMAEESNTAQITKLNRLYYAGSYMTLAEGTFDIYVRNPDSTAIWNITGGFSEMGVRR